ncbi:MAG: hypothetical protein ACC707_17890 [Thiohalomonadales bacterium]
MIKYFFVISCIVALFACGAAPIPPLRGEQNAIVKTPPKKVETAEKTTAQNDNPTATTDHLNTTNITVSKKSDTITAKNIGATEKPMAPAVKPSPAPSANKKVTVFVPKAEAPQSTKSKIAVIIPPKDTNTTASSTYLTAEIYVKKKKYQLAISILEQASLHEQNERKFRELMLSAYIGHTNYLIGKKKYNTAKETIIKAIKIAPKQYSVVTLSKDINRKLLSNKIYQQGLFSQYQGDVTKALQEFNRVLAIDKDNIKAQQRVKQLTRSIVISLHEKAMELYDGQKLDEAIAVWEELLRIDPDHRVAQDYIKKSIGIKKRMSAN